MPVFSCGGMRYQFKWQDVAPAESRRTTRRTSKPAFLRALERASTISRRRAATAPRRCNGPHPAHAAAGEDHRANQGRPQPTPRSFCKTFETSMRYLRLDHVDLLALHGINNRELLDWTIRKNGCLAAARQLQTGRPRPFIGFSTHATTDIILAAIDSGEFDYVNLHWYFVNDLNWPAVEAARARDMGVFIISPNDKGGKLYEPPPKLVELCAPLTPMQFNDLYCLARPEVHTLSCGAARPGRFRRARPRAGSIRPLPRKRRADRAAPARGDGSRAGRDWCARWSDGLAPIRRHSRRDQVLEILRLWTYAKSLDLVAGARCATTSWARPTIGSRVKTRQKRGELALAGCLGGSARLPGGSPPSWRRRISSISRSRSSG